MSELRTGDRDATWLELELGRQLGPVAAPDSLWDRIQEPKIPPTHSSVQWQLWLIAATLLLATAGSLIWRAGRMRDPVADMEKLAEQELSGRSAADFRSADPAEIRAWV